jgi:ribosomal protein S18 acetylase RimI-like enzyme
MQIRKASVEDIVTIVDFQVKMAAETESVQLDKSIVIKGVSAVVNDSSKGQYYVTEMNGIIVASLLTTFEWSDWRNGTILWIQSVYVLKDYRRKGVYRKMYSHIKNLVLENVNLNGIRLYADKSNTTAQKTYQELGMNHDHYITFEWLK